MDLKVKGFILIYRDLRNLLLLIDDLLEDFYRCIKGYI